jgi:hypothetical protein
VLEAAPGYRCGYEDGTPKTAKGVLRVKVLHVRGIDTPFHKCCPDHNRHTEIAHAVQGWSQYLLLGGLLGLRRLLLFLATFFRGTLLGSRTLLLGCLRGHALGRGWLVMLWLEQRTLPL